MKPAEKPQIWELARQLFSDTRQGYNLLAQKFENSDYVTPTDWIESSLDFVERRFPATSPLQHGLDLACGSGRGVRALAPYCRTVEGLDFSEAMLTQAQSLSQNLPHTIWTLSDLSSVVLPVGHYDRIVTFGAWGHVLTSFRVRLLKQMLNSLNHGGVLVTITADEPNVWEKRFWTQRLFDLAIRIRNKAWFNQFHMYYRLNGTNLLLQDLNRVCPTDIKLETHRLFPPGPPITLVLAFRKPND